MRLPPVLGAALLAAIAAAPLAAHDANPGHDHDIDAHVILGVGTFDRVPPQSEYYGHFFHARTHHGPAHHGAGHKNAGALYDASGEIYVKGPSGDFVILVEPNLVNRASAQIVANGLSLAHCRSAAGPTRITYDRIERHAPDRISAWMFAGHCD